MWDFIVCYFYWKSVNQKSIQSIVDEQVHCTDSMRSTVVYCSLSRSFIMPLTLAIVQDSRASHTWIKDTQQQQKMRIALNNTHTHLSQSLSSRFPEATQAQTHTRKKLALNLSPFAHAIQNRWYTGSVNAGIIGADIFRQICYTHSEKIETRVP